MSRSAHRRTLSEPTSRGSGASCKRILSSSDENSRPSMSGEASSRTWRTRSPSGSWHTMRLALTRETNWGSRKVRLRGRFKPPWRLRHPSPSAQPAHRHGSGGSGRHPHRLGYGRIARMPRGTRGARRSDRRSPGVCRRRSRHVLGCAGDGSYGPCRPQRLSQSFPAELGRASACGAANIARPMPSAIAR